MLLVIELLLLFMFLIFLIYIPIKGALNDSKRDKEFSVYSFIERTIASFVGGLLLFGCPFVILAIVFGESATTVESSITHECSEAGIFDSDNCDEFMEDRYGSLDYSDDGSDSEGYDSPGYHYVDSYYRSDGTHVDGYMRSNPDGDPNNNLSGN